MSNWLDPVRRALDEANAPVTFFFRDDDAGWGNERLFLLLDLFGDCDMPLDLAVIPLALTQELAHRLYDRVKAQPHLIGVHQHGFAHVSHESEGRKCEFGSTRDVMLQERDIRLGRHLLNEMLGPVVQPIFTPPWNRCSPQTGDCLVRLGFQVLSRDQSAPPLKRDGLRELPIHIDWFAKRKGVPFTREQIGSLIAEAMNSAEPVGVMFHHALMDESEMYAASELLSLLSSHDRAQRRQMVALAAGQCGSQLKVQSYSSGCYQS